MLRNYLAAALRNLARNRLYAGITIAGLAIGFAAALLIALFVRDEFSYDRFIPGHERVYRISQTLVLGQEKPRSVDYTPIVMARALQLDFPRMDVVARATTAGFPPSVRRGEITAAEQGVTWADPGFFRLMPVPVLAGNLAHALDTPDSVVINRSVARKYFGRAAPLGETLLIDKRPMRVTAVIKDLPSNTHLVGDIFPSALSPASPMQDGLFSGWLSNRVATYYRLKPGAAPLSPAEAAAFVDRHYGLTSTQTGAGRTRVTLDPVPIADIHMRPAEASQFTKAAGDPAVVAAIGAVGILIVAVAAINFVTLMTARAARRAVEVGVRKAAGATRRDLIIQFMGEAFIYVLLAGIAAVALAELLMPAFNGLVQRRIAFDYLHDPALAAGIVGVLVVVALLAGAYPALVLSGFRPAAVLKGDPVQGVGGARVRQVLVIVQFSVLIALILMAGTIYRQTMFAIKHGTRVDTSEVVLLFTQPCTNNLRQRVQALPGVRAAACSSAMALSLSDNNDNVTIGGKASQLRTATVDFGFFEVYRVRPSAGRLFDRSHPMDGVAGPDWHAPVVINETAARRLGYANPATAIGKTIQWHGLPDMVAPVPGDAMKLRPSEIIGVVPDFSFGSVRGVIPPTLYAITPDLAPPFFSLALNVRLDPAHKAETLAAIERLWKRTETGPLIRYFVDQFMLRLYVDTIVQGAVITACALIALSIACLGLFALSAYTTERRTKEIGIRKAMGASAQDILKLLLWQFTVPVLWANLLALPVAWLVLDQWLKGFAYHVDLTPWSFAAASGAAILIAWATVFTHALKVSQARPVGALRYE